MEKVYCDKCKHFEIAMFWEACWHPDNLKETHRSDVKEPRSLPCIKNMKNNCPLFEKKE